MRAESISHDATREPLTAGAFSRSSTVALLLIALFFLAIGVILFGLQVKHGLGLYEDSDEMEVLVAAQMMTYGKHLYRDIFVSHGPIPYMLAHFYASAVSRTDFSYVRLSQALLAALSCIAIALSPIWKTPFGRLWAAASYLLLLACVWNPEGFNILEYDTLGGYFFVIVISQLVAPLLFSAELTISGAFASGAAAAFACFCANSNTIAVILFVMSGAVLLPSRRSQDKLPPIKPFFFGIIFSLLVVGAWLREFGDPLGYLVYHFYFNLGVYKNYAGISATDVLGTFSFSSVIHTMTLVLFLCWLAILIIIAWLTNLKQNFKRRFGSLLLIAVGVVFTNILGRPAYGDSNFVNVNFALFAIATTVLLERYLLSASRGGILASLLFSFGAIVLLGRVGASADLWFGAPRKDELKYIVAMKPSEDPIYKFVRSLTRKEGDFLSLTFYPDAYLKADRLPASGNLYYSIMQADYYRHPVFGYRIDLCADIRERRPAVIWLFNWRMWREYSIDEDEPCVLSIISAAYTPLTFDSPWLIRNDLFDEALHRLPSDAATGLGLGLDWSASNIMQHSAALTTTIAIDIKMSPTHQNHSIPLRRIGIMFATDGKSSSGGAELHLKGLHGTEFSQQFLLDRLDVNKYHYFDLEPRQYTSGEIRSLGGTGISTWESQLLGDTYTCAIYEYVDNSHRYTPACPIM